MPGDTDYVRIIRITENRESVRLICVTVLSLSGHSLSNKSSRTLAPLPSIQQPIKLLRQYTLRGDLLDDISQNATRCLKLWKTWCRIIQRGLFSALGINLHVIFFSLRQTQYWVIIMRNYHMKFSHCLKGDDWHYDFCSLN